MIRIPLDELLLPGANSMHDAGFQEARDRDLNRAQIFPRASRDLADGHRLSSLLQDADYPHLTSGTEDGIPGGFEMLH